MDRDGNVDLAEREARRYARKGTRFDGNGRRTNDTGVLFPVEQIAENW